MSNTDALELVLNSATSWARGHEHCMAILQACEIARAINQPKLEPMVDYWCRDCQDYFLGPYDPLNGRPEQVRCHPCPVCGKHNTYMAWTEGAPGSE